ncbi:MAG: hypothetical protein ACXWE4_03795 [Methylobacter sp.]
MNTSQNNSAQNSEQNQPLTINDLHQAFAELAFSYGMASRKDDGAALICLEGDCEKLVIISQALRLQAKGGVK